MRDDDRSTGVRLVLNAHAIPQPQDDAALIDTDRLDDDHRLAREPIHLLLLEDARRGLADVAAGRTVPADEAIAMIQQRRAASAAATSASAIEAFSRRG